HASGLAPGLPATQHLPHRRLPVAAVATERPDAGQLSCFGPACDRLRVDTEERGHLGWGQESLGLRRLRLTLHARHLTLRCQVGSLTPTIIVERPKWTDYSKVGLSLTLRSAF